MTRDEYFIRLQKAAVRLGRYFKFSDVEWSEDELVTFRGKKYFPSKYILSFDRKMQAVHTCELHDLKAESVVVAKLSDVGGGD